MQDLSSHLPDNPLTPSSMSAANTTSADGTGYSGPGSPSEVIDSGDIGHVPSLADITTSKPRTVLTHGEGYSPSPVSWKDVP